MKKIYLLPLILIAIYFFGPEHEIEASSHLTNDEYVEAYREEVRAGRPSLSYIVFEPIIVFFKNAYNFINAIVTFIYESILDFLNKE